MDSFVLSVRTKDNNDNLVGGMGGVSYLKIPEGDAIPNTKHKVAGVKQWMDAIVKQAAPDGTPAGQELDIVFFVHGYNTDAEEALKRQRHVQQELAKRNYTCVVVGFDWPTVGNAAAYLLDRSRAQDAAALLTRRGIVPFARYSSTDCPVFIHVMAHSMGAFVVREAFRAADKTRDPTLPNDWKVGQMVLFAGDISSKCFELNNADMSSVFSHCGRLTNYFSGYDEALAVSNIKNVDLESRVGRVGMPVDTPAHEKALDVDCSQRYKAVPDRKFKVISGMMSHSWYLEDDLWYDDLAYTLAGQIDRDSIPTRKRVGQNDFILNTN